MDEQKKSLLKLAGLDPDFKRSIPDASQFSKEIQPIIIALSELTAQRRTEALQLYPHSLEEQQNNFDHGYLDLRIDFNKVNSIENLKGKFDKLIKKCWQQFLENHDHSTKKDTKDFKLIHLVGTLRNIHKKTWGQIIGHPDFPRKYQDPLRTAKQLNEDYKYLIQGGWKNYWK